MFTVLMNHILALLLMRQFFITTARLYKISGRVLSSHSIVSSSRTIRPCSPWGARWIGHWRTTSSTVCSSVPHPQGTEEAIPHLCKQEWKHLTWVWRQLSRTQAVLGRVILRVVGTGVGDENVSLVGLFTNSVFYWWSAQCAARMLILSKNWWLAVQRVQMGVSIWDWDTHLYPPQHCCCSTPISASKPPQECDAWCQLKLIAKWLKVSVICEHQATCPTLLWGIWARDRRVGFHSCSWVLAHVWLLSHMTLNTLTSRWFWLFSKKNSSFWLPCQRPSSSADCARELFNGSNGSANLVDCTQKKIFAWGVCFFCEWRHKWKTFRPTLPGPGRQPLGGSISLKFLLETRLQSESFDALYDLLGFRVQKL